MIKEKYNSLTAFAQASILFLIGFLAFGIISIITTLVVTGFYPEIPVEDVQLQIAQFPVQYMLIHFMPFQIGFFLVPGIIYTVLSNSSDNQLNQPKIKTISWAFLLFGAAFFLLPFFSEINLEITKYFGAYNHLMAEKELADQQISNLVGKTNSISFYVALLLIGVVTGIAEEFVFRRFLFHHLLKNTHKVGVSVFSSAILFSLLHFNYIQLLPLFTFGVVLALMYYVSGSIIPGIIAHAINNMLNIYWLANGSFPSWMGEIELKITIPATLVLLGLLLYQFGKRN